jgi:hypothetical protein
MKGIDTVFYSTLALSLKKHPHVKKVECHFTIYMVRTVYIIVPVPCAVLRRVVEVCINIYTLS